MDLNLHDAEYYKDGDVGVIVVHPENELNSGINELEFSIRAICEEIKSDGCIKLLFINGAGNKAPFLRALLEDEIEEKVKALRRRRRKRGIKNRITNGNLALSHGGEPLGIGRAQQ